MCKLEFDKDLIRRFKNAAANGSKIAKEIVTAIAAGREPKSKLGNNFKTCRVRKSCSNYSKLTIKVYYCNKDFSGKHPDSGNPSAPYYAENRNELSITKFAKLFIENEHSYTQYDYEYLENIIALPTKIKIVVSGTIDGFLTAYDESRYSTIADSEESCLHNSCMRYAQRITNVADFYANFAGAKILYAEGEDGLIYGRAVLWPEMYVLNHTTDTYDKFSSLERIYYCFSGVRQMIINKATEMGIIFRKTQDTADTTSKFTSINPFVLNGEHIAGEQLILDAFVVPKVGDHFKGGTPYMDTYQYLCVSKDNNRLILSNVKMGNIISTVRDYQSQTISSEYNVCPICGNVTADNVCKDCLEKHSIDTYVGRYIQGQFKAWYGVLYPAQCFDVKGNPSQSLLNSIAVRKLQRTH